jgi:hypothetical protein
MKRILYLLVVLSKSCNFASNKSKLLDYIVVLLQKEFSMRREVFDD